MFPLLAAILRPSHSAPATDKNGETRLQTTLVVVSAAMMTTLAVLWGGLYFFYHERLAATIPLGYAIITCASLPWMREPGWLTWFRISQLALSLLLPFLLALSLGGFVSSSAVVLWSVTAPMGALVFAGRREAHLWFGLFVITVVLAALCEPWLAHVNNLPRPLVTAFFVMNVCGTSLVAFVLLQRFVREKEVAYDLLAHEQLKSEQLLLNVLPREISVRLKDSPDTIADHYPAASVLFADMVGFTKLSERVPPVEMLGWLNEVFSHFDTLVEKYGLEKIRTIGDNFMVASGVPRARDDHAVALAAMALEMRDYVRGLGERPVPLSFRIGIGSGPVIGGVIGRTKFAFDVWGDAVNTASRMESTGIPGEIQIAPTTYALIEAEFICEARGPIEVKGKGPMTTWLLVRAREACPAEA